MNRPFDANKPMQVGGQAVLEGVMMRAPGMVATAVRRANGEIVLKKEPHASMALRYPALKLPILRGAVGLIEMMFIGIRTLNFSAEIALDDVQEREGKNGSDPGSRHADTSVASQSNGKLAFTVGMALLLGVGIFFVTPLLLTSSLFNVSQQPHWFNLIAGGIRVGMLILYLLLISRLKEVKRLFEYHGAEHKAVFAFERGESLDVESAARQSRFHPRCGTSFLLIVMLSAVVLFSLLDAVLILWLGSLSIGIRLATHLPLIPLVGGLSYEFIRFSAKHSATAAGRIVVAPGLWLQKITTREPDKKQIEVALAALRCALGDPMSNVSSEEVLTLQGIPVN